MKNRNIIYSLAIVLMPFLTACDKHDIEREELRNEIKEIEARIDETNQDIASLQAIITAIQEEDYITGVEPAYRSDGTKLGYVLHFLHGSPVTISSGADGKNGKNGEDGKDASGPDVSVKQGDDGVWYWQLNGKWLLDDSGNKFRVYGKDSVTPKLRITNGEWYVSYDNGLTWSLISEVKGTADSRVRQAYSTSKGYYVFRLSDGSEFIIPKYSGIDINIFIGNPITMSSESELKINYSVVFSDNSYQLAVTSTGGIKTSLNRDYSYKGTIGLATPANFKGGTVSVVLCGGGAVISKTINVECE